ncbi:MAG: signal peptide peptidase SppA [Myxococcales bacterium]|nr:signal peptide peptidase SppA [Myxococcales bacterium]
MTREPPFGEGLRSNRVLPALLRLFWNALRGLRDALVWPFERRVPRDWLALTLDQGLVEAPAPQSWFEFLRRRPPSFVRTLELLERARSDPSLRGVILRVGPGSIGWGQLTGLVRGIERLHESGKHSVVYANRTGNAGAWLGAAASHFWVAPEGRVDLLGIQAEGTFLLRALERWRIVPEVVSAGAFKSVGEILTRDGMSEPAREALDAVLESLYDSLVSGLATARAGDAETARRWIDEGPYLAHEALERGLIDACVYGDEVPLRLAALDDAGEDPAPASPIEGSSYLYLARRRFRWDPVWRTPRRIALVPITGILRPGSGSPLGVVGVLRSLATQDSTAAVVLRIDTPGGDALASDLIWRAVQKLAEEKPVVASLGNMAASGGYYISMAAHWIVAETTTLTGSIGVAALTTLGLEGLMDSLGVDQERLQRGRHAGIFDLHRARTDEERALLQRQVDHLYGEFVRKAAEGRGLSEEQVEAVARGRVWTGRQALEHRLIDALGGIEAAVERARELAGLAPDEGRVDPVQPARRRFSPLLRPGPTESERVPGSLPLLELLASGACFWCPIRVPLR